MGKNKPTNVTLALYSFAVAAWSFGQVMTEVATNYDMALFWARFHLASAIFLPVFFIHFVSEFLETKDRKVVYAAYILGIAIFLVSFTNVFVSSVSAKLSFKYYPDPGPAFMFYSIMYACLVLYGIYQLVSAYRSSSGNRKNHIMAVLIASILGFSGGSMMFLPVYNIPIYPVGYYFVPVYIVIAIYAFMKHRFLDISIVIKKGLVYSVLTLTITAVYVLIIFFFQDAFKIMTGRGSVIAMPVLILALVIFLNPLKDMVQKYVDRIFFRGKYDYQKALRSLSSSVRNMVRMDDITSEVAAKIMETLKVGNVALYAYDKKVDVFVKQCGKGINPIPPADPLVQEMSESFQAVEKESLPEKYSAFDVAICFPMVSKKRLVGIMMLGEKLSGDIFTDEDIDLLFTLCNQMAVSIENAVLNEEAMESQKMIYQADKLATVGTLAASLAHEIKNPIGAIKGFTQVIDKAVEDHDMDAIRDFKDVVPRQLDRINEIMERLLMLSRPGKKEKCGVDVNKVLDDIIKLIKKQAMKQQIEIVVTFDDLPKIKADPGQLTQAFLNLALNAVQAMPNGGLLELRTRMKGIDNISVEVIDTGTGISVEKLPRIFDPFFTTKETGSGLGLAVTKKIIDDHRGNIEAISSAGKGTSFTVVLPA